MSNAVPLTPQAVKDLIAKNRVAKAPNYHASNKRIKFDDILLALMDCLDVRKDAGPEHPTGCVAFCTQWGGALWRVDFNIAARDDGDLILVVTAMEVRNQ